MRFKENRLLGQTKLIPWSSDFPFENMERESDICFYFFIIFSKILRSERYFFKSFPARFIDWQDLNSYATALYDRFYSESVFYLFISLTPIRVLSRYVGMHMLY